MRRIVAAPKAVNNSMAQKTTVARMAELKSSDISSLKAAGQSGKTVAGQFLGASNEARKTCLYVQGKFIENCGPGNKNYKIENSNHSNLTDPTDRSQFTKHTAKIDQIFQTCSPELEKKIKELSVDMVGNLQFMGASEDLIKSIEAGGQLPADFKTSEAGGIFSNIDPKTAAMAGMAGLAGGVFFEK